MSRPYNFGAGPSPIPLAVLQKAQEEFLNYAGTGMSVMELSHRGSDFNALHMRTLKSLRRLLSVPETHEILLMQGRGSLQFSAVVLNILASKYQGSRLTAHYIITGTWSKRAADEAIKLGKDKLNVVASDSKQQFGAYTGIPEFSKSEEIAYSYYCDNETVHGVEFPVNAIADTSDVVCDMSSNLFTRNVDFSRFAVVFAGAQKNAGTSGVTIVIIKRTLLDKKKNDIEIPLMLDWTLMHQHNSLYNTPAMFPNYILMLMCEWMEEQGGLAALEQKTAVKSQQIYKILDSSNGFYKSIVQENARSRINIVFRLPTSEQEQEFLSAAEKANFLQLKGHRSVGGIRISLYNAVECEAVEKLAIFMLQFMENSQ